MKRFQEPPFKQNAIALGFTLGVHAIAIVGLLFLGLSKPPEQPKKLTTILVKPEDLPPPLAKPVEQQTTAENQAEEILSPVVDNTQPENVPVTPPTPTAQQLADAKQKAKEAAQAKQAEEQSKIAAKQRADEEVKRQTEQATADKAAKDKAAADKAAKDKADAERAEADAKAAAAKKAEQEAAQKKADSKKIASTAIQDFRRKIDRAWHVPQGTSGKKVTVRFTLSDSGAVLSKVITKSSGDDALDASILAAIDAAAPYPMPDDPDARREARTASPTFIAK